MFVAHIFFCSLTQSSTPDEQQQMSASVGDTAEESVVENAVLEECIADIAELDECFAENRDIEDTRMIAGVVQPRPSNRNISTVDDEDQVFQNYTL